MLTSSLSAMSDLTITGFDHLVLYSADIDAALAFYTDQLGLESVRVDEWRAGEAPFPSVRISPDTIIDLLATGQPSNGRNVDHICLVASAETVDTIDANRNRFRVVDGPDHRFGARGIGWSIYILDPDDNTVEIRTYDSKEPNQ